MRISGTRFDSRQSQIEMIRKIEWDYVVVGGGITGAQIFRKLSEAGQRVLLIDSGDFASGTSSQSGMLIWGGLTYLRTGHLYSVIKFSKAREKLISDDPTNVIPLSVRYVRSTSSFLVFVAFLLYWVLGWGRRSFPKLEKFFPESSCFEKSPRFSYLVEEAVLKYSDARYVLDIIFSSTSKNASAANYIKLQSGKHNQTAEQSAGFWDLNLSDMILKQDFSIRAKFVVNCTGPSTEIVNSELRINKTPYRHVLSKGVYLRLQKPADLKSMLVIDLPKEKDVITLCPVGETALWGPTETKLENIEDGFAVTPDDVKWLAEKYQECFGRKLSREQVVSVRAGVRPLCVAANKTHAEATIKLSRNSKVSVFPEISAASVYGGKFTGAAETAEEFMKTQRLTSKNQDRSKRLPSRDSEDEMCWCLEDYLRRRSDVHQTIHNGGLGLNFENSEKLRKIALEIFNEDPSAAEADFNAYVLTQRKNDLILREALDG